VRRAMVVEGKEKKKRARGHMAGKEGPGARFSQWKGSFPTSRTGAQKARKKGRARRERREKGRPFFKEGAVIPRVSKLPRAKGRQKKKGKESACSS